MNYLTEEQIEWAMSHNWFDRCVLKIVKGKPVDLISVYHAELGCCKIWQGSFAELKIWAGY